MQKFDVQIALEGVREAREKWTVARREFTSDVDKVMDRLIHEAAACFMSVEEVARFSGLLPSMVRKAMRRNGLDPRDGKTLLAKHAAEALASNSELLGIAPHEMDLTSPLAYLPMGSEMRQALTDKTTSPVHELHEDEVLHTCPECRSTFTESDGVVSGNVVIIEAEQHERLEQFVAKCEGQIPVSVESLVSMAIDAFLAGLEGTENPFGAVAE